MVLVLPLAACSKEDPKPVSASASVSADKASKVQTPDGALAVTIPKGAASGEGTLQVAAADAGAGEPGWEVTLTGARLVGDAVLRFKWAPTQPDEPLPLITYSDGPSTGTPTVVQDAIVGGGFVEVRTNHFSFWQIQPWGTTLDQAKAWVSDSLDKMLSSGANGHEPTCQNESDVRKAGYKVTSDSGRRVYWCLGKENGHVVLKAVNARGYATQAEVQPGLVKTSVAVDDLEASLIKLIPSPPAIRGNSAALLPAAGEATYRVDGQKKVELTVRPDGSALMYSALLFGVDTLLMVLAKQNIKGVEGQVVVALTGLSCMSALTDMASTEIDSVGSAQDFLYKALQMSLSCVALAAKDIDLGLITNTFVGPLVWLMTGVSTVFNSVVAGAETLIDLNNYRIQVTPPVPVAAPAAKCGAKDLGLNLGGATGPAADKARKLYRAVIACDKDTLVRIATADDTELSLGMTTPEEAFAIPNPEDRYSELSRLLSVRPAVDSNGTVYWPWSDPDTGEPDVAALVKAGLIPAGTDGGAKELGMYIGFRLSIGADGKLGWFAEGE